MPKSPEDTPAKDKDALHTKEEEIISLDAHGPERWEVLESSRDTTEESGDTSSGDKERWLEQSKLEDPHTSSRDTEEVERCATSSEDITEPSLDAERPELEKQ